MGTDTTALHAISCFAGVAHRNGEVDEGGYFAAGAAPSFSSSKNQVIVRASKFR
ncbi:hypothetical protein [Burkholderia lata]|uniref:hypothetical protein n=1 Tax=Burkholderia lata (strain ATCC 17760 / DSM 23089 / LMG 22485 / NCIMB 9086 / R18194 / 383) TaxID=482957 RepID=UPI00030CBD24|nr:hypothetical protein [Burkholderia lata]